MTAYGTWAQWRRRAKREPGRVTFYINECYSMEEALEWKARHRAGPLNWHSLEEAALRAAYDRPA